MSMLYKNRNSSCLRLNPQPCLFPSLSQIVWNQKHFVPSLLFSFPCLLEKLVTALEGQYCFGHLPFTALSILQYVILIQKRWRTLLSFKIKVILNSTFSKLQKHCFDVLLNQDVRKSSFFSFVPSGCLLHYLRHKYSSLQPPQMTEMVRQVASAMMYLESRNFIHRDLVSTFSVNIVESFFH